MIEFWTLPSFARLSDEPILGPDPGPVFRCPMAGVDVAWRRGNVFNPAAAVVDAQVCLVFRAEDASGDGLGRHVSRLGLARSEDGVHFTACAEPVLFPAEDGAKRFEWPGGCEDPRLVQAPDGRFVLTYTAWDRKQARLCVATSQNLVEWTKHGPAFAEAGGGVWLDTWSKAGSIVCEAQGDALVAARVSDRYWMYWGEGSVYIASSTDLIAWTPAVDPAGRLVEVLRPRTCMFDSELVEPGPPAVLTPRGILLIYNGKNDWAVGDPSLTAGAYCPGQALFSSTDPLHLVDRTNMPFLRPETEFERTGQYLPGTVFASGLVTFGGRRLLYYGCGDSVIGVAATRRKS